VLLEKVMIISWTDLMDYEELLTKIQGVKEQPANGKMKKG
jgi:hypothetical protein